VRTKTGLGSERLCTGCASGVAGPRAALHDDRRQLRSWSPSGRPARAARPPRLRFTTFRLACPCGRISLGSPGARPPSQVTRVRVRPRARPRAGRPVPGWAPRAPLVSSVHRGPHKRPKRPALAQAHLGGTPPTRRPETTPTPLDAALAFRWAPPRCDPRKPRGRVCCPWLVRTARPHPWRASTVVRFFRN